MPDGLLPFYIGNRIVVTSEQFAEGTDEPSNRVLEVLLVKQW